MKKFLEKCREENFQFSCKNINYGKQVTVKFENQKCSVIFYDSGKILVQGKDSKLKEKLKVFLNISSPLSSSISISKKSIEEFNMNGRERIGIDESGKGDYFGPLVITASYIKPSMENWLIEIGVKDSKMLRDENISQIASLLKKTITHKTVKIFPKKYNSLYDNFRNLNKLLAWGHAKSLETLLETVKCDLAISDKFSKGNELKNSLQTLGKNIKLVEKTKAESDLAVATSSIIARYEFITSLKYMKKKYSLEFSKGASPKVESDANLFINKYGFERLNEVAKLHFKTTEKLKKLDLFFDKNTIF